ncbi:MAG TPA: methyltransferase domain-containing protein [Solirubrobacteraceae bacterium]|nr:methyltransferase domain-containing protein [Solirubrobacteraceae bacterium]
MTPIAGSELEERIASFPWWYYRFEFDGGARTPVLSQESVNRAEQLHRYLFDALLGLTGGSLRGLRVLDLGCNAGLWSLRAIEAGAEFVLGIDSLQMAIEQAQLVFEAKGVAPERYRFEHRDLFAGELDERFDVVLCLDLLDQVARPVELFELMARSGAELILIETSLTPVRYSYFELRHLEDALTAVDDRLVLVPSREAVVELAAELGFQTAPLAHRFEDHLGLEDYRRGRRLAFLCAKQAPLDGLALAGEHRELPWWLRLPAAGARGLGARLRRRA